MSYASRLRSNLDQQQPTSNRGYVGRKLQDPNAPTTFGRVTRNIDDHAIEAIYQKKLLGGFSKKNLCSSCNIALPATNVCDYC